MKKKFLLLFLAGIFSCCVFAQPAGTDDSIMKIQGKWKKGENVVHAHDPALAPGKFTIIYKKLDSVAGFFKQAYPVPAGIEAKWYASISEKPLFEKGPSPYGFWSVYKYYYYNKNYKKIILGDETGTWAYVFVNHFNWFLDDAGMEVEIQGQQKRAWRMPRQLPGEWKGQTVFEPSSHQPFAKAAVISKNGGLPWKSISQLEYLQALRKKREEESAKMLKEHDDGVAKNQKLIAEIRNKKDIPADMKSKMLTAAEQQLDRQLQNRQTLEKNVSVLLEKDLAIIREYISLQTSEILSQPAIINKHKNFFSYKKFEERGHKDAVLLVYIDQGYFNKALPSYEPQFMVIYWRWNDNLPGRNFKTQLEENFPVEKLKAMLK